MSVRVIRGNVQELSLAENVWIVTASGDNATATATKTGVVNKRHFVTGVSASFSVAKIKLLQIKDGTTVKWEGYVHNALEITFSQPIEFIIGNDASAVLEASGTAGEIGKVNLTGFTEL